MTSFSLKIVALVFMFCDHFGDSYIKHFSFFNLLGRISFPIFAFQISEGFIHTQNIKKYFFRIGIFALISQIPFSLFMYKYFNNFSTLNIFFTLFLGLLSIYLYNYINNVLVKSINDKETISKNNSIFTKSTIFIKILSLVIVFLLAGIAQLLNTDYGAWGVILVFIFYAFKDNKVLRIFVYVLLVFCKYISPLIQTNFNIAYISMFVATLLSYLFIDLYNGKQGKKIKYLLYLFYPLHLLVLYFIF